MVESVLSATKGLPTPLMAVRETTLVRNIDRMQATCDERGVKLRPHAKTHKSTFIAELQRNRGAAGFTVATLSEAERLAASGHDDLLAVFSPVDEAKRERLAALVQTASLTFSVDDLAGVGAVSRIARMSGARVGYYWEVDTGTARAGSLPEETLAALKEARRVFPAADFAGLMSFGGHIYSAASSDEVGVKARHDSGLVGMVARRLEAAGIELPSVSVGATPGAAHLLADSAVTELRSGNYVYNDATQLALGAAGLDDCAQFIVSTVTGRPTSGRITIDAGSKAVPKEIMSTLTTGYGLVSGHPDLVITRLYEEVGVIEGPAAALDAFAPGGRVAVIPNHSCMSSILYPEFALVHEDGQFSVIRIDARDH